MSSNELYKSELITRLTVHNNAKSYKSKFFHIITTINDWI